MSLLSFFARLLGRRNIQLPSWQPTPWRPAHVEGPLTGMLLYAEQNAQAAIDWYWDKKSWNAITSRARRLGAILCTAAAALIPIIGSTGWFGPPAEAENPAGDQFRLNWDLVTLIVDERGDKSGVTSSGVA